MLRHVSRPSGQALYIPCDKCHSRMEFVELMPGMGSLAGRVLNCSQCGGMRILPAEQ
jgi:hypothetical protein